MEQTGSTGDTIARNKPFFAWVASNKERIDIDMRSPEGRRILDALLTQADVLVENVRACCLRRAVSQCVHVPSTSSTLVDRHEVLHTTPHDQRPSLLCAPLVAGRTVQARGDSQDGLRLGERPRALAVADHVFRQWLRPDRARGVLHATPASCRPSKLYSTPHVVVCVV